MKTRLIYLSFWVFFLFFAQNAKAQYEYWFTVPNGEEVFLRDFFVVVVNGNKTNLVKVEHFVNGQVGSSVSLGNLSAHAVHDTYRIPEQTTPKCSSSSTTNHLVLRPEMVSSFSPTQKGLMRITGTEKFECYIEKRGGADDDIFVLKGESAKGDLFIIPAQNNTTSDPGYCKTQRQSFFVGNITNHDITINVTPAVGASIIGNNISFGHNSPKQFIINAFGTLGFTSDKFDFTSVQGIGGTMVKIMDSAQNGDQMVITVAEDLLQFNQQYWTSDLMGDQLLPVELNNEQVLGKDYVLKAGIGTTSAGEYMYLFSPYDNNVITISICGTNRTITLQKQESYKEKLANGKQVLLSSTKPMLVYQTTNIRDEIASSVVPPLSCKGSTEVVLRRGADPNGEFLISLFIDREYKKDFKFEKYNTSSSQWEVINNNTLTIIWNEFCDNCNTGSGADLYAATTINVPKSVLALYQKIRVTNHYPFAMSGIFKESGSAKFGYFSSFNIAPPPPKFCTNAANFCYKQLEPYKLSFCDGIILRDLDITLQDASGLVLESASLRNYNRNYVDLNEVFGITSLPIGQYTLCGKTFNALRICGRDIQYCSFTENCVTFEVYQSIISEANPKNFDLCSYCTTINYPRQTCPGGDSKIFKINPDGSRKEVLKNLTDGETYLEEGEYIEECFMDKDQCEILHTKITVTPSYGVGIVAPDQVITVCFNPKYNFRKCFSWDDYCNEAYKQFKIYNSLGEEVSVQGIFTDYINRKHCITYLLNYGSYFVTEPIPNSCDLKSYNLEIIPQPIQEVMLPLKQFTICSLKKQKFMLNPLDYCSSGTIPTLITADELMLNPVGGLFEIGPGIHTLICHDPLNCISYIHKIEIIESPTELVEGSQVVEYCGLNSCYEYTLCAEDPRSIIKPSIENIATQEILTPNGQGLFCLPNGSYYVVCTDVDNCKLYRTTLVINSLTPSVVDSEIEKFICDGADCYEYDACPPTNTDNYVSYMEDVINEIYLAPQETGKYCLPPGEYISNCLDEENCLINRIHIKITAVYPTISHCYRQFVDSCDDEVLYNQDLNKLLTPNYGSYNDCMDCEITAQADPNALTVVEEFPTFQRFTRIFTNTETCKTCVFVYDIQKRCYVDNIDLNIESYFEANGDLKLTFIGSAQGSGNKFWVGYNFTDKNGFSINNGQIYPGYYANQDSVPPHTPIGKWFPGEYIVCIYVTAVGCDGQECVSSKCFKFTIDEYGNVVMERIPNASKDPNNQAKGMKGLDQNHEALYISKHTFKIAPNPTSNFFRVINASAPYQLDEARYVLTDLSGRTLVQNSRYVIGDNIYINDLPTGIYLLSLSDKNGTQILRVNKQNQ